MWFTLYGLGVCVAVLTACHGWPLPLSGFTSSLVPQDNFLPLDPESEPSIETGGTPIKIYSLRSRRDVPEESTMLLPSDREEEQKDVDHSNLATSLDASDHVYLVIYTSDDDSEEKTTELDNSPVGTNFQVHPNGIVSLPDKDLEPIPRTSSQARGENLTLSSSDDNHTEHT